MVDEECKKCLALLEGLSGTLRDLAFMIPTATGTDELYFATIDSLDMLLDDLKECVGPSAHKELRKRFEELSAIDWVEEKAADVAHELTKLEDVAYSSTRKKVCK